MLAKHLPVRAVRFFFILPLLLSSCNMEKLFHGPRVPQFHFVYIPPGSFMMGADGETVPEKHKPIHRVTLTRGFEIMSTEVTQAQWNAIIYENSSTDRGDLLPVNNVSWNKCQEFIQKLNELDPGKGYRLPTEAEWEYACRAGTLTQYYWGDAENGEYCWARGNSDGCIHPVGTKKPNAWGLYDMSGNVTEWCEDFAGNYPSGPIIDPRGPESGYRRIYRGGHWCSREKGVCSWYREEFPPQYRFIYFGFRLVRNAKQ